MSSASLEDAETMFPATRMPDLIDVQSVRRAPSATESPRTALPRPSLTHPAVHRGVERAPAPVTAREAVATSRSRDGRDLAPARGSELLRLSPGRAGTLDLDVASDPLRAFLMSHSRSVALRESGGAVPRLERIGARRHSVLERTLNAAEVGPGAIAAAVLATAAVIYGGVAAYANERREVAAPQLSGQSVTEWASDLRQARAIERATQQRSGMGTGTTGTEASAPTATIPGMISMPEVTVPEVAPPVEIRHLPLRLDLQGDS